MCCTYILFSKKADRYYIGHTCDDLNERIRKHNTNHTGFTGKFLDWKLMYTEFYTGKSSAIKREKEIKAWKSKIRIEKLISEHPA